MNMWEIESMRLLSSCYLSSLHEYQSEESQRPYATEASLQRIREEDSQRMRAMLMSKAPT